MTTSVRGLHMAKSWYSARRRKNARTGKTVGEISIFSDIGAYGVTASDFNASLKGLGKVDTLDLRISSNGGDVSDGFAIFNMLDRHSARVVVTVEGLAASMASVIAMAGDEVVMPSNAMMMIHNPWGGVVGEGDQIVSFGEALMKMQASIIAAYAGRTGLSDKKLSAMMNRETWLSAEEAVELGFADSVQEPMRMAASIDISKFSHAPKNFRANMESKMTKTRNNAARANAQDEDMEFENTGKTEAEIRADLLAHSGEVRSLCALAGFPELAEGFVTEDKSLSDVTAALTKAKADKAEADKLAAKNGKGKTAPAGETNAHNRVDVNGQNTEVKTIDPVAIMERFNGKKATR